MSDKNFKVKNGLTIQGTVDTLITPDNSGGLSVGGALNATSILTPVIEVAVPLSFVPTAALCMFGDAAGPMTFSAFTALGSEYLNLPIGTVITIPDGLTYAAGIPISGSGTYTILSATPQEYGVDYALQMGTGAGFGGNTYGGGYVGFDTTSLTILFSATTGSAGTAGQVLKSTGTGLEWADAASGSGLPEVGTATTENFSTLLNFSFADLAWDNTNNSGTLTISPATTIDDAALAAFNTDVPGGTNFTLSYNNVGFPYSTTFTKTGAAESVMSGMLLTVPVQYVSGNTLLSAGSTPVTISYGVATSGKFLTNDGTTSSWATPPSGLPSLGGGTTTEDLSIALNVSLDVSYDNFDNPSFIFITPYGTIDDAAIAEFNTDIPNGTNFTLSFTNSMNNPPASYLTTFTKTGSAENVMGMQIKIPVEYVVGNTILFSFGNAVTIEYGQSNAGKFLTNNGTTASWGDLKSSASGSLSGSGTASWSSWPVNTYPAGNPYGIKTINGQKRVVMPNVANFQNMPIGSTVTFSDEYSNNGVGGSPTQQTLTTTGLYDGSGFDISEGNDTSTSDPGGNHTFVISWTGTEPEHAITADDLRLLSPDAAGSVHHELDMIKIIPASGTISGSESSFQTKGTKVPYGRVNYNGKTFARIPNMANLENMPINSSLNVSYSTLICIDGMCGFSGGGYIYSAGDLLSTYDGYKVEVPYDANQSDEALPTNDQYSYTQYWTVSWEGSRPGQVLDSNNFKKLTYNPKIYVESFEGNPENKTETVSYTWTVPERVYSIYATVIGGGGAAGSAEAQASSQNGSSSQQLTYGNNTGADSTIIYNGTTYRAKGGTRGLSVFDYAQAPQWDFFSMPNGGGGSGSGSNTYFSEPGDKRPGRGGIGVNANASASSNNTIPINGTNRYFEVTAKANATSGKGNDGDMNHFTIPVVPGSTLELSVGQNGGEVGWGFGARLGSASSNAGAIYIRYVK